MRRARLDLLIVGGGPSGLGAAWALNRRSSQRKISYLLFDTHNRPGGWARSIHRDGFTFDFGGHVLFPHKHYREFSDLLKRLPLQWWTSCPARGTWTQGRYLPYPVQQNIHRLKPSAFLRCAGGLLEQEARRVLKLADLPANDLESYLTAQFGRALKNEVMGPLNEKMWAYPAQQLDTNWVGHRSGSAAPNVPTVKLGQLAWQFLTSSDRPGWTEDTAVAYPRGGMGEVWRQVARQADTSAMRWRTSLVRIDAEDRIAYFSDGSSYEYEQMISAVPLDQLLRMLCGRRELSKMAGLLKYSRSYLTGVGVRGRLPEEFLRLHSLLVPDREVAFWRLNFPSNVSPSNTPSADCWSALCEISEAPKAGTMMDRTEVLKKVIAGLRHMGLLVSEGDVMTAWCARLEHGYPTPFLGRDDVLAEIQPQLEDIGILSRGRFGGWKYEVSNQDHAFMQGMEAAELVAMGNPEETYTNASVVNG